MFGRIRAERLAREKASAIAKRDPDLITIGADTIVVVNRKVLGKPRDTGDAARMLALLSGREHVVTTAVAVSRGKKLRSAVEEVSVRFRRLRDDEIDAYMLLSQAGRVRLGNMVDPKYTMGASILKKYLVS